MPHATHQLPQSPLLPPTAAVFQPVPFRSAIADGCTHLLVLCTRPTHLTRRSRVSKAACDTDTHFRPCK